MASSSSSSSYSTQKSYHVPTDASTRHVQLSTSAWHVLEQPPPPTLREILNAYKSKGDGDREMLLAMLNAKSSEDQRIAAIATLHHKLLEHPISQQTHSSSQVPSPSYTSNRHGSPYYQQPSQQTASQSYHSSSLSRTSPSASPQTVTLPPIHVVGQQNSHKRSRSSQSPPSYKRRHSDRDFDHSMPLAPSNSGSNEQLLPPSPPSSSPGRSTTCSELASHSQSRGDAMAIGSLLSTEQERDSEWPSRTSAERDRDRDHATYHTNKQSKVFG